MLPEEEQRLRISKMRAAMAETGMDSAIVSSNANLYYLTGRVFSGYMYLPPAGEAPVYCVKRPVQLADDRAISIRKPESIIDELKKHSLPLPVNVGLELQRLSYADAERLMKALGIASAEDADKALNRARAVKTPYEIKMMRLSGAKHELVYRKIPQLYIPGMTDIELQIEIERLSRLEGCLGQFRVSGEDMELYMGNILVGDNADAPSPYDFAMGGAGLDPSLPVGANGSIIRPGESVMVDMNGNFTGYMTDMTRTFACGRLSDMACDAHALSIRICAELARMGTPGTEAKAMYEKAEAMVAEAGLADYFMGHRQHAGFIGHGVGIEINESPVIAPRSRDILQAGNTIALEPKFVIPGVGAVGIENTYAVGDGGMECLTKAPEELISLDK